jgi:hypothetical protein
VGRHEVRLRYARHMQRWIMLVAVIVLSAIAVNKVRSS